MTAPAPTSELPRAEELTIDRSLDPGQAAATVLAARRFYAFWGTGEPAHLDAAIAPRFHDYTLPPGRPQGPDGPLVASRQFRAAMPDLSCAVEELLVVGEKVTARLRFRGTFTGRLGDVQGDGRPIEFIAIDVIGVRDGRVVANWHLEDNLSLIQQLGA